VKRIGFFLPALILFGVAGHVVTSNRQGGDILAFPFLGDLFPSLAEDPIAMGDASAGLLGFLATLSLVRAFFRARQAMLDEAEAAAERQRADNAQVQGENP
jgi:hypothetical protein